MMRRWISCFLAAAMLFVLLPLPARAEDPAEPTPISAEDPAETAEPTALPEPTGEPEPTSEPEPTAIPTPEPTMTPEPTPMPTPTPTPTPTPAPQEPGMKAFAVQTPLPDTPFQDVPANAWYADAVKTMYALGLVNGVSSTTFSPSAKLTAGECAALSVRVFERYHGAEIDTARHGKEPWHAPWMRAALQLGMITADWNGDQVLTRAQAMLLMYRTLPASELQAIRTCGQIPGLMATDAHYSELLCLYNAGVVSGVDAYGTLSGSGAITRAQYITLLARLIQPELRDAKPLKQASGMAAFSAADVPKTLPFQDVKAGSFYWDPVCLLYHTGMIYGTDASHFSPSGAVTLKQAVVLCVRVYERYHGAAVHDDATPMDDYLPLAVSYGILPANWSGFDQPASRAQVAYLIAHTLPDAEYHPLRRVASLPDVKEGEAFSAEIFRLYRAGVLNGSDAGRTFHCASGILRSELAAMFARLINPALRIGPDLKMVESVIQNAVKGYEGTWSVYLSDINSGRSLSVNPRRMWSASEVKLYVAGAVVEAIETGRLSNSERIQSRLSDMISWSSNSAWKELAAMLGGGDYYAGMERVNEWSDRNGYPDSGMRSKTGYRSTTSAVDCGHLLERVLAGTHVSAAASSQMLSLLRKQEFTSKIPAGVPKGVPTANKTGELDDVENDAAIIFAPFGTYVFVVLTQNGSIRNIRALSALVYSAMEQATA